MESGQFNLYDNRTIWPCSRYIYANHVLIKEKQLTCLFSVNWSPLFLSLSLSLPRSLPLSGRSLSKQNKSSQGLVGLRNLGNTVSVPCASLHTWRHCTSYFKNGRTHSFQNCRESSHILWHLFMSLRFIFVLSLVSHDGQCFMNSILQCLSNTPELRDFCLRYIHPAELSRCGNQVALMEGKTSCWPGASTISDWRP